MAPTMTSAISTFLASLVPSSAGVGLFDNTAICPVPRPKLLLLMDIGAAAGELCLNGSNVASNLSKLLLGVGEVVPSKINSDYYWVKIYF